MENKNILLVEDNPNDELLALRAFKKCNINSKVTIAHDGEEAISLLENNKDKDYLPDLVLLDLNLPKISGIEVLRTLKQSENLRHLPVVVMTTSRSQADINSCYDSGANSYMCKPIDYKQFVHSIEELGNFWLNWNTSCPNDKNKLKNA